ncbi:MAG: hypothetical protein KDI13_03545 [Alphaproteobacteria bacterium]|nr:hypothetical protein [Alphaproteobacteria bacterium]
MLTLLFPMDNTQQNNKGGISPRILTANKTDASVTISVLFIGNSYTFYNNMPQMIIDIANSDPGNKVALELQSITIGGATLEQLWKDPRTLPALKNRHWDYVILQEQSTWAMFDDNRKKTREYAANFTNEARQIGAKTLIYQTWPRKQGTSWYKEAQFASALKDSNHMQSITASQTKFLADLIQAKVVPVSDYWMFTIDQHPDLELYDKDGSHPSLLGSYLTALIFYRTLTDRAPQETAYIPAGLEEMPAAQIKKIASYGKN